MIEIRQGGKQENQKIEQSSCSKEPVGTCQPKNFRQIGSPSGKQKVYFEDYVYTYLHPVFDTAEETRICILLGHVEKENDIHYIFISAAMELKDIEFAGSTPIFQDRVREEICSLIKRHFDGLYLVGWFLDLKGNVPKLTPELERIHRNFFGGRDKVFLLSDSLNRDEKLFACENNAIWQKEGYYIYYEKNPRMQEYMITRREEEQTTVNPEEVMDEALKSYREILLKKEERTPQKFRGVFYVTSCLLLVTVCVLGFHMKNNSKKMKELEGAISVLAGSTDTEQSTTMSQNEKETEKLVVIETIDGNVEKMGQTETEQQRKDSLENEEETENVAGQEAEPQQTQTVEQTQTAEQKTQQEPPAEPIQEEVPALTEAETIRLQGYYIVQKGETLAAISRKIYGDTAMMKDICTKNGIENSDEIYAGQKLLLP